MQQHRVHSVASLQHHVQVPLAHIFIFLKPRLLYMIQVKPVRKPVGCLYTRYNRLSNGSLQFKKPNFAFANYLHQRYFLSLYFHWRTVSLARFYCSPVSLTHFTCSACVCFKYQQKHKNVGGSKQYPEGKFLCPT